MNRALSTANSCLYGICHAAIVSAGFSPALGFIHTGKMLSFVYDVADLYKTEITVPIAFRAVAEPKRAAGAARAPHLPRPIRLHPLLERIIPDIQTALMMPKTRALAPTPPFDQDAAAPGFLWDPSRERSREGACSPLKLTIRSLTMVVLILERVPPGLRGELTRWFLEPQAGVFVGRVSAAVRERLWEKAAARPEKAAA